MNRDLWHEAKWREKPRGARGSYYFWTFRLWTLAGLSHPFRIFQGVGHVQLAASTGYILCDHLDGNIDGQFVAEGGAAEIRPAGAFQCVGGRSGGGAGHRAGT